MRGSGSRGKPGSSVGPGSRGGGAPARACEATAVDGHRDVQTEWGGKEHGFRNGVGATKDCGRGSKRADHLAIHHRRDTIIGRIPTARSCISAFRRVACGPLNPPPDSPHLASLGDARPTTVDSAEATRRGRSQQRHKFSSVCLERDFFCAEILCLSGQARACGRAGTDVSPAAGGGRARPRRWPSRCRRSRWPGRGSGDRGWP